MSLTIRKLKESEIGRELFRSFDRRQVVTQCLRRRNGVWQAEYAPFIDQWSEEDYGTLICCLRRTVRSGGVVFAAFPDGKCKGFVSVEPALFGLRREYMDLSSLHVSEELRGQGLGRLLFRKAAAWAREHGARKLYISSHSAVETQAFYQAMGCVDAVEIHEAHAQQEPFDRPLEYRL
ncbi:MAG TPA: GNAT family N-acetyltransferase [Firmicutes bacterium]|nr:GNAT family N-acetyltransferase [Bacillota bacterium]